MSAGDSSTIVEHRAMVCPDLDDLAEVASAEGYSFVRRAIAEWRSGGNRFDRPGEAFFLALDAGGIVGMCGVNIDPFDDDPTLGRLRHLYVEPTRRRRGIGRQLVRTCIAASEVRFRRLRLRTFDPAASAFHASMGFVPVPEEHATHAMDLPRMASSAERESVDPRPVRTED